MSVHFRRQGDKILILGQTYPHKDAIKRLGGTFNGQLKLWQIDYDESHWAAVKSLCESLGGACLDKDDSNDSPSPPTLVIPPALPIKKTPIPRMNQVGEKKAISVSELLEKASSVIASNFPGSIWIEGEIQNLNIKPSAIYFNLAEGVKGSNEANTTTVAASMWNNAQQNLLQKYTREVLFDVLRDGQRVRILAMVNLYRGRASLSLVVQDIDLEFTKGELALSREVLRRELRRTGLDQLNRQKVIPTFPFRIGLISADGSRAESDFVHQLWEGGFAGEVIFRQCPMQGEDVPLKLPIALAELSQAEVDIIVVTRGGGSLADLRWFDAKEIAFAIARCPIPIIAAIGHQEDFTIAEEVAHTRAKTPTAAAEVILECFRLAKERLKDYSIRLGSMLDHKSQLISNILSALPERIESAISMKIQRDLERVSTLASDLSHLTLTKANHSQLLLAALSSQIEKAALAAIGNMELVVMSAQNHVDRTIIERIAIETIQINSIESQLSAKNPLDMLERGWTRLEQNGKKITSVAEVLEGDIVVARLKDGLISLEVRQLEKK